MANTIKNADGTYTVHLSATEWEWAAGSVGWEVTTDRKLPRQVKVEEGQDRDGPWTRLTATLSSSAYDILDATRYLIVDLERVTKELKATLPDETNSKK